jgi:hypothetical protein
VRRRPFSATRLAYSRKYALPAALLSLVALAIMPVVGPHLLHIVEEAINGLPA